MYVIMVYDVNVARVQKVLKTGRKYLTWVQNSVFEGELTEAKLARLQRDLQKIINPETVVDRQLLAL
ncbi:MAG: CRISPR-associated endonuclease Cas2 [Thermofilaceae archaeon]